MTKSKELKIVLEAYKEYKEMKLNQRKKRKKD